MLVNRCKAIALERLTATDYGGHHQTFSPVHKKVISRYAQ